MWWKIRICNNCCKCLIEVGFSDGHLSDLPNKEASSKKMFDDIEQFLETKDFEGVDLNIYDGIVTRYFHDCIERNKPIDELGKSAVNRLFSNLPEGMSHKYTMLYKTQLLRASRDRDDIFELIPKASIESYETYLFNPDLKKNGKIVKGKFSSKNC